MKKKTIAKLFIKSYLITLAIFVIAAVIIMAFTNSTSIFESQKFPAILPWCTFFILSIIFILEYKKAKRKIIVVNTEINNMPSLSNENVSESCNTSNTKYRVDDNGVIVKRDGSTIEDNEINELVKIGYNLKFQTESMSEQIVTFEERKKTSICSKNGLYVAEILLLAYCKKGAFPITKYGYQAFWKYQYGIFDVDAHLKSLEERNFIRFGRGSECVHFLTVQELKDILRKYNQPVSGKKADLIKRILDNIDSTILDDVIAGNRYVLTPLGEKELKENSYVPHFHNHHNLYNFDCRYGDSINVWKFNLMLNGDCSNWENILKQKLLDYHKWEDERNLDYMNLIREFDPTGYNNIINGTPKILKNSKIVSTRRTLQEDDKSDEFFSEYYSEIEAYEKVFHYYYWRSKRPEENDDSTQNSLKLSLNTLDSFKSWCKSKGTGGKLYFHDIWEQCFNYQSEIFSFREKVQIEYLNFLK